jgi:hypothetical protein
MNNLATNGRIEDIAVAKDVKGMKLGLRILEALVHVSVEAGCHKVSTSTKAVRDLTSPRRRSTAPRPTRPSTGSLDS